ncbi:MAG TPA: right-handed parallel beta-helix repeat-containing protein, partial [Actinomycetes bacterium]|nr:right-handed parallel beta-helix repeat-containing protein [Actinomycetes bacterium]
MSADRSKDGLIAILVVVCLVLAGTTTWALATRGSSSGAGATKQAFWVAPDGDDSASGSRDDPWATVQHAVDESQAGTTVYVRGGTYDQRFSFNTSGEPGSPIAVVAEDGEQPVLDGSGLDVPEGQSAMVEINGQHDVTVEGLEITGYRSDVSGDVPIGVFVAGDAHDVLLAGLTIHDLGTNYDGRNGGDAHGIAVYGTSPTQAISGVEIVDNELYNLSLGSSESLVLNGNVKDFLVEGNKVHDTNNIGIDVIGFEGTVSDPTLDQARDGVIRGNQVWNIDSKGNPAYGNDRSADGIYVDGGRDVLVESNVIHDVNIGIELASEHAGRATRNITVRNNLVYDSTAIGLAIGGYDRQRGSTENCTLVNNTVVRAVGPALLVQFDTRENLIANNVIVAGKSHIFVENQYSENVANTLDYNLYQAEDGSSSGTWQWKGQEYGNFEQWQARSGNDKHSMYADPGFADVDNG